MFLGCPPDPEDPPDPEPEPEPEPDPFDDVPGVNGLVTPTAIKTIAMMTMASRIVLMGVFRLTGCCGVKSWLGGAIEVGVEAGMVSRDPQEVQKCSSGASWVPQFWQYLRLGGETDNYE